MTYKYAVIDIETTGLNRYKHNINYIGIGLSEDIDKPLSKKYILNMYEDKDLEKFLKIVEKLKKHKIQLIYQNGKFDTLFIDLKYGIMLPIHQDIMLMGTAYAMSDSHALDDMAERYLGIPSWDIPLKEKTKPNNLKVENEYLPADLENPWKLFQFFNKKLDPHQRKVYNKLLMPPFKMYRRAEKRGIFLDREQLQIVQQEYKIKGQQALDKLKARYDINWNSPQQIQEVFYDKEKYPTLKRSEKTGKPSADVKVMKRLISKGYDLPQMLMDYKFYYGAESKFLKPWSEYSSFDGRIHPHFGTTDTVTGRTNCSDPNLQQVARRQELRQLYTAQKGRVLIEADYSQIELRIAAHYAKEPTMLRVYQEDGDIHTETAQTLVGGEPTKEDRTKAKAVNFGFIYGMQAKGFIDYAFDSYNAIFTSSQAERYRDLFFQKYPWLLKWHHDMEILCELQGGVANLFGRFRSLPDVYSANRWERSAAVRRAINTPVQSTASDILVSAVAQIDREMRKDADVWVVGTVHDSGLFDVPESEAEAIAKEIQRIMSKPQILKEFGVKLSVPLKADVGIGPWGSK